LQGIPAPARPEVEIDPKLSCARHDQTARNRPPESASTCCPETVTPPASRCWTGARADSD